MAPPPEPTQVPPDVMDAMVEATFMVTALLSQVAAAHDLSLTQLRVLGILRDREPKMAQLAQFLGLERSTVSGLIDRAERRGLVRRTASGDDGRSVLVGLTAEGHRQAALVTAEAAALITPILGRLPGVDQEHLRSLLRTAFAEHAWPAG
jgi:DNA-binding MarR family transcriptional regulator